jgi:hypothetical protein
VSEFSLEFALKTAANVQQDDSLPFAISSNAIDDSLIHERFHKRFKLSLPRFRANE